MNRGSPVQERVPGALNLGFNEAPIHESGKSSRPHHGPAPLREASMRPRFMNRGSVADRDAIDGAILASMRPRFMNRGSRRRMRRGSAAQTRFNEAPIHESGKCERSRDHRDRRRRASMRPRFMNRGSSGLLDLVALRIGRFNEAPIHESGKYPRFPHRARARYRFNEAPIHESGKSFNDQRFDRT